MEFGGGGRYLPRLPNYPEQTGVPGQDFVGCLVSGGSWERCEAGRCPFCWAKLVLNQRQVAGGGKNTLDKLRPSQRTDTLCSSTCLNCVLRTRHQRSCPAAWYPPQLLRGAPICSSHCVLPCTHHFGSQGPNMVLSSNLLYSLNCLYVATCATLLADWRGCVSRTSGSKHQPQVLVQFPYVPSLPASIVG